MMAWLLSANVHLKGPQVGPRYAPIAGRKKVVKMLTGLKTKAGLMLRPWVVLGIYAVLLALYVTLLHPWLMNWGATEAERRMALPGDEVTASPETTYFTRAITINAPADEV